MDSNLWVRPLLGLDFEGLASILHDFFSENLWFFIHLVCLPHATGRVEEGGQAFGCRWADPPIL